MRQLLFPLTALFLSVYSGFVVAESSYPIIVRPLSVARVDVPAYLQAAHPHEFMVIVRFIPVNHSAAADASNLEPGEGSWLDRGMKPMEPENIRFFVPVDDPTLLYHTLKTSDSAFRFTVYNTGWGFFDTVPLLSPQITLVGEAKSDDLKPDDELNQIYQKLLTKHADDKWYTNALRLSERAWISYRDIRANLEAWAIGKDHPDDGAHDKELRVLTLARIANLKRSPIDGLNWKFTWPDAPPEPGDALDDHFGDYAEGIAKIPGFTTLWDNTKQSWFDFQNAEMLFESHGTITIDGKDFPSNEPVNTDLQGKVAVWLDNEEFGDLTLVALKLGIKPKTFSLNDGKDL